MLTHSEATSIVINAVMEFAATRSLVGPEASEEHVRMVAAFAMARLEELEPGRWCINSLHVSEDRRLVIVIGMRFDPITITIKDAGC